jgi:hypothetical protein
MISLAFTLAAMAFHFGWWVHSKPYKACWDYPLAKSMLHGLGPYMAICGAGLALQAMVGWSGGGR